MHIGNILFFFLIKKNTFAWAALVLSGDFASFLHCNYIFHFFVYLIIRRKSFLFLNLASWAIGGCQPKSFQRFYSPSSRARSKTNQDSSSSPYFAQYYSTVFYHTIILQIKLADLDDVDDNLPSCSTSSDCGIDMGTDNRVYALCQNGVCSNYRQKSNMAQSYLKFFIFLQLEQPPGMSELIGQLINNTS